MPAADLFSDPVHNWTALHARLERLLQPLAPSRAEMSEVAWHLKARTYRAGETIVRRGEASGYWGVVVSGEIVAFHGKRDAERSGHGSGKMEAEALLSRGDTFGEGCLLRGERSAFTLQAASDVEVYSLYRPDVAAVLGWQRLTLGQGATGTRREVAEAAARRGRGKGQEVGHREKASSTPLITLQVAVVILLLAALVGAAVYLALGGLKGPTQAGNRLAAGAILPRPQITLPAAGALFQRGSAVVVHAIVDGERLVRADLAVDGALFGMQLRRESSTGPWEAEWVWQASGDGEHLFRVDAFGPEGERVSSFAVPVTVVPEGWLVFSSNRDGPQVSYAMRSDGTGVQRLPIGPGDVRGVSLSQDGAMVYAGGSGANESVIRYLAGGASESRDLVMGRDPALSPDGSRLAFVAGQEGVNRLLVMALASGRISQITEAAPYVGQPAWSPDGLRLAYVVERDRNLDVWMTTLGPGPSAGGARQDVRLTDDAAVDWAPAWSPNGLQLAFVSNRAGSHQIYVMQADGSGVRPITDLALGAEAPAWSPDGHWLAFVAYTGSGAGVNGREIHLVRADGGESVRLTYNGCDDSRPIWVRSLRGLEGP